MPSKNRLLKQFNFGEEGSLSWTGLARPANRRVDVAHHLKFLNLRGGLGKVAHMPDRIPDCQGQDTQHNVMNEKMTVSLALGNPVA